MGSPGFPFKSRTFARASRASVLDPLGTALRIRSARHESGNKTARTFARIANEDNPKNTKGFTDKCHRGGSADLVNRARGCRAIARASRASVPDPLGTALGSGNNISCRYTPTAHRSRNAKVKSPRDSNKSQNVSEQAWQRHQTGPESAEPSRALRAPRLKIL